MLYCKDTPNIPKDVVGRDVEGRETRTQWFLKVPWLCVKPRISPFQHYQLAHPIIRCALTKFNSTKQLVTVMYSVPKDSWDAVEAR